VKGGCAIALVEDVRKDPLGLEESKSSGKIEGLLILLPLTDVPAFVELGGLIGDLFERPKAVSEQHTCIETKHSNNALKR
jgi:hypothetical protein